MLSLQFNINADTYGLNIADIIEITPLVNFRKIFNAPDFVAGIFNYRGAITPVIDLKLLFSDKKSDNLLSTRIIITSFDLKGKKKLFGLIAEQVMETITIDEATLVEATISFQGSSYLGKTALVNGKIIQLINCTDLLPDALKKLLFAEND